MVGKYTVALYLAQLANCEDATADHPCGRCGTCRQIAASSHPDVIHLLPDPSRASPTISVAQVREVVRRTGYHRYNARRRFILVDPAEAMNAPAANALLKTLEEPPAGTGFILIATNASSLLPTIRSRCQQVRFAAVEESEILRWLNGKGVDHAERVARMCHGCPGRAMALVNGGLAEQTALRDDLLQVIGADLDHIFSWSSKLTAGKSRAVWSARVLRLLDTIDELLRDAAIVGSNADQPLLNADMPQVVTQWSQALWPAGVTRCAAATAQARTNLERNVSGRLLVEALITRIATELGSARRAAYSAP